MRDDKYQKLLILLGTMFVTIFGMAAPTAWAQNPKATRSQLSPSPHICTVTVFHLVEVRWGARGFGLEVKFNLLVELTYRKPRVSSPCDSHRADRQHSSSSCVA